MKIGSLVVEIAADSAKFDSAVTKTENRLDVLSRKARVAVGSFAKYTAAAGLAGAAIGSALVAKASAAIDAQAKLAQRLNTTSASMAALERAGDLSGVAMEKIAQGSGDLTRRLSQAATKGGPVAEALDAIGLSAQQLQSIPLDQRIEKINQALVDNAAASQRAAIAGQLFGEEGALFMTQINPEVLAQARKETELFGLALSDVDAAQVEMANDAMSTFGNAADGIIQQLTVQLAPILKAISDQFVDAADEAGGFGNAALDAFDKVITASAFVADAADGIKRTFQLTSDGIIIAINSAMATVSNIIAKALEGMSKIPGVDFSETVNSLNSFAATSESIVEEAWSNVDATLAKPFAGDALRQFVEDARAAGQAAAEAAVQGRASVQGGGETAQGLSPEDTKKQEELQARIEAIRTANATELELLTQKHTAENEALNAALEKKALTEAEWFELAKETKARQEEELTAIEEQAAESRKRVAEQEARAKQAILSQAMAGLTSLMNSNNKQMFEIGKKAAIANSLVSTYQGMSEALKLGYPVGLAAAAAIGVAGFAQVQNIRSQNFQGGGGSAAAASTPVSQVNAQSQTTEGNPGAIKQTMTVSGIDEGELFSGGRVRSLVGELLEYQRNGGQVVLA